MNWILASGSPRRRELLEMLGVPDLTIRPATGPERATPGAGPEQTVRELSLHKAQEVAQTCTPEDIIIAADTIVYLDGAILGKPKDHDDAVRMLTALSGREHIVYTGVAVLRGGELRQALSRTHARGDRALHRHRRADGQGRGLRHSGPRGAVRRASGRRLFQRDGPAAVQAGTTAERTGSRAALNWKTYLKKKGARVGVIVVAVVLVLALIAGALGGRAGFLTNLDGIVRAPLQKAATVTAQWLESIYGYIYKYDQLKAENEQLRTQLAEAQAQAREGQEAIAENERYRDLLGFTQRHTDFELEPANVVSYGASNWSSTLTLSKGSDSGIAVGDCVMNESGALVGQVIETGSTWATVRTVIDVDMSVGGYISGSGATAMVLGDFTLMQQGCVRFGYLAEGMSIFTGDTVLTSGKGGAFPAGLVVGTITDVRTEAGGQQTYGVITPACDLGELLQVFVIKDFDVVS